METQVNNDYMRELMTVAKRYVDHGLHVISVHSHKCQNEIKRGKVPTYLGWQRIKLTWPQLRQEILRVWQRESSCNIGIQTGKASGLICLDIDSRSGGLTWYNQHVEMLGSPLVERTSAGGLHLYYRYPIGADREIPTKRLADGVELLSDGGHQVVTWPSIHSSGTAQYTFERSLDLIDAIHEADEPPMWLLDAVISHRQVVGGENKEAKMSEASAADITAASYLLDDLPPAVQGHGGDAQTLKAALLCRDFGLSLPQVYKLLQERYNPRCVPPWSPDELRTKVRNAFKYGKNSQGVMSISTAFDDGAITQEAVDSLTEVEALYSKKHAVHSAKLFINRMRGTIDCYNGQFVAYDKDGKKWRLISDSVMESFIYRDIEVSPRGAEIIQTMKAQHISDIRKVVKFQLNKNEEIPDVHWRANGTTGANGATGTTGANGTTGTTGANGFRHTNFITMQNGILNVETQELLPHSKDWFCFQSLPISFDNTAECPEFVKFLYDVWDGDTELVESLRLWMGYCLLSSANLQKFAVFKGASRGGKSTLASVIENLVGRENTASTSLSLIGSDFGIENLLGKKLVVFQDADRASQDRMGVATERIKSIASNDPVGINRKNQSVVFQRLNTKIAFVCNKMPPFLNDENALTNRMVVFPFWKSFQGKEDFSLGDRLIQEIPGVLRWALLGAKKLLAGDKLFTATRGIDALDEITQQLDSVYGFIAEAIEIEEDSDNAMVLNNIAIWNAYREWCKDSGRMPKNKQRFFIEFGSNKVLAPRRVRTSTMRGFRGVKLLEREYEVPF